MDLAKFEETNLLEKPLSYLKEFLDVLDNHIKEHEDNDETVKALYEAVKRTYFFKYNLIKRDILNGIIAEIEQQSLKKIKQTCDQYVYVRQTEIDQAYKDIEESYKNYLDIVHSDIDIEFVKQRSTTVNELNSNKEKHATIHGVEYIINRTIIEFLEKTKETIEKKIEEIKQIQELLEPFLKEKQHLGICTIVPVKKLQTQIQPLVSSNQIPDELKDEVVYKKLNTNKAKQWIANNPAQNLFSVKEKTHYIRIINNSDLSKQIEEN